MQLVFTGWHRSVYPHRHQVSPILRNDGYSPLGESDEPLVWNSKNESSGKVTGLALSGDFRVKLEFQAAELGNWLKSYVNSSPEQALRLITKMQAEAIIALNKIDNEIK